MISRLSIEFVNGVLFFFFFSRENHVYFYLKCIFSRQFSTLLKIRLKNISYSLVLHSCVRMHAF